MKTDKYIFIECFAKEDLSCLPETLEPGKVYFCKEYSHSVHLCPCGCGEEVHIPFKEEHEAGAFWGLKNSTFTPSIQRQSGCKSHYSVIDEVVKW